MNRLLIAASIAFAFVTLALLLFSRLGIADQQDGGLPGALDVIDARRFPTLQAALDTVSEQGGIVLLPAGEFEIAQPLRIRGGDVTLEGAGTATNIKNVNTQGEPAILLAHAEHKTSGNDRDHELWRIRLANFRVTGNEKSGPGIAAYNVNEIFIDGVTVSYHGGDGILLSYCYEDPRICQSLVTYNKQTGLNLQGCHDIVVAANQFEENQDAVRCYDGFNLCMSGNCLDDHLGRGVVIENTYGSVVSGNMIEECAAAAITLDRDCYGITLSANVIAHNGAGIDLRDAHGCAVSANTLTIMKSDALRIGAGSGRIAVGGNSFSSSYIGEGRDKRQPDDRATAGLVLDDAKSVLVEGNIFSGIDARAIQASDKSNRSSVITGNLLVDTEPGVPTLKTEGTVPALNYSD